MRRLIVIISVVACLTTCARPPARYVSARTAAVVTPTKAAQAPIGSSAAVHSRAFHRWILHVWLTRFYAGLEQAAVLDCGGSLPPCYVMWRESGGDIHAENPVSTASGKWQFLDTTWNDYDGYAHASWAPALVQNAKAREVWAGGAGASHWACC